MFCGFIFLLSIIFICLMMGMWMLVLCVSCRMGVIDVRFFVVCCICFMIFWKLYFWLRRWLVVLLWLSGDWQVVIRLLRLVSFWRVLGCVLFVIVKFVILIRLWVMIDVLVFLLQLMLLMMLIVIVMRFLSILLNLVLIMLVFMKVWKQLFCVVCVMVFVVFWLCEEMMVVVGCLWVILRVRFGLEVMVMWLGLQCSFCWIIWFMCSLLLCFIFFIKLMILVLLLVSRGCSVLRFLWRDWFGIDRYICLMLLRDVVSLCVVDMVCGRLMFGRQWLLCLVLLIFWVSLGW